MHESLRWSATGIAARIGAGDITAVEVVDAHIRRIEAVNPALNAVVADRFDAAREEARAVRPGDPRPLAGVPITIKEFVAVQGMPHTGGILHRRAVRAAADSPVTARLRAAGAIVLGVTNAPEGGLWAETNNPVYGRTSNPHDLGRTSGGSSGGEGAVIAAGGSPLGIGSDTGGSIRLPAAFCGIAGHKPTGGLVPNTLHFPDAPGLDVPVMTTGPMARRVEDLMPALRIIAGPDGVDRWVGAMDLGDPATVDLRDVTVYPVAVGDADQRAAVIRSTEALVAAGARRAKLAPGVPLREAMDTWAALLRETGIGYDDVVSEGPVPLAREAARYLMGRSAHAGGVLAILALQRYLPIGRKIDAYAVTRELTSRLEDQLGPNGVILHPTYTRTAPHHRGMAVGRPADVGCTTLFNVTASPVTVVRVGQDRAGMPIGLQVAGSRGRDHVTMAVALELERAFGGWTGPVEPVRRPRAVLSSLARRVRP